MPSIIELGDLTEKVEVRPGKFIEVNGISAKGLMYLLTKFPDLRKIMTGLQAQVEPDDMMQILPQAVAAIIACGTGNVGNAAEEEAAERIPIGVQLECVRKIWDVSFPKGLQSFIDALGAITVDLQGPDAPGQEADTKSPEQLNGALPTVMASNEAGTTRPAN